MQPCSWIFLYRKIRNCGKLNIEQLGDNRYAEYQKKKEEFVLWGEL